MTNNIALHLSLFAAGVYGDQSQAEVAADGQIELVQTQAKIQTEKSEEKVSGPGFNFLKCYKTWGVDLCDAVLEKCAGGSHECETTTYAQLTGQLSSFMQCMNSFNAFDFPSEDDAFWVMKNKCPKDPEGVMTAEARDDPHQTPLSKCCPSMAMAGTCTLSAECKANIEQATPADRLREWKQYMCEAFKGYENFDWARDCTEQERTVGIGECCGGSLSTFIKQATPQCAEPFLRPNVRDPTEDAQARFDEHKSAICKFYTKYNDRFNAMIQQDDFKKCVTKNLKVALINVCVENPAKRQMALDWLQYESVGVKTEEAETEEAESEGE